MTPNRDRAIALLREADIVPGPGSKFTLIVSLMLQFRNETVEQAAHESEVMGRYYERVGARGSPTAAAFDIAGVIRSLKSEVE